MCICIQISTCYYLDTKAVLLSEAQESMIPPLSVRPQLLQNIGVVDSAVVRTAVVGFAVDGTGVEDSAADFIIKQVGQARP
jgi:hypothetical protein